MLTNKEKEQIRSHGADIRTVEQQIINFKKGFSFTELVAAATRNNGIIQLDEESISDYDTFYKKNSPKYNIVKFVPASGMASRMFKELFEFHHHYQGKAGQLDELRRDKKFEPVFSFIENLDKFAFYDDLKSCLAKDGFNIDDLLKEKAYQIIIEYLVDGKGLNYDFLPKGLLKFHRYENSARTAIEEHIVESVGYCINGDGIINIHFTLSPEHIKLFETHIRQVLPRYEKQFGVKISISHSIQCPSTDTIAVDMNNEPLREDDGSLIFRKSGHGALLKNLENLDAEIVFIKNIDNIVPDRLKAETIRYKKVIGGLLIYIKDKVNKYLAMLHECRQTSEDITEVERFCQQDLMIRFPDDFDKYNDAQKANYIYKSLNRPIRICGLVKNEGEPGGGPFWVKDSNGRVSLQIVESSQVDKGNPEQKKIFESATHFNPVDLVCSIKDYKGDKFNLQQFVDPETGFISIKHHNGKNLKAQELPGLWNGSMAYWLTSFVEVPLITFNPVKTVNDLLRPEHQQ
jgi:hypothetical protein